MLAMLCASSTVEALAAVNNWVAVVALTTRALTGVAVRAGASLTFTTVTVEVSARGVVSLPLLLVPPLS